MRERMRRRKKPSSENLSESTGKIGQQIDRSKPAPLVPSYLDAGPSGKPQVTAETREHSHVEHYRGQAPRTDEPRGFESRSSEPASSEPRKMEMETQPDSPFEPPAAPDAATDKKGPKKTRGVVVLAIGLPGSGKTTWFKRRGVTPLSSDMLRTILFDNITEQRYQGLVFSTLRSLLRARLIAKMPWNYVDATNLSPHERRQWIKMSTGFGYEVHAVFFDVPTEVCLERNRKRERQVQEEVLLNMAQRLKPPTFKEGFSKIVVVRVKGAEPEPA